MRAGELTALIYSPQWTSKMLHYFLSGVMEVNSQGIKFELLYFAMPFISDRYLQLKLSSSNKASTFASIFKSQEFKTYLIGKNKQLENFREITNQGLIYLGNHEDVSIAEYIKLANLLEYNKEKNKSIRLKAKAAYNWGCALGKEDYLNVFLKLGVCEI